MDTVLLAQSSKIIFPWPCWLLIGLLVLSLFLTWIRRHVYQVNLKARTLERFNYTHKEIFPLLNKQEKTEMMKVLENTVLNAAIAKQNKNIAKGGRRIEKKINKEGKRVVFRL